MKPNVNHQTALWLLLSALLLSSLIPGGPIENRDFSHIHPGVLGAFNIFLTSLDLGSFVVAYFVYKGRAWAMKAAFAAAVSYFAVYAVDLAQLFPRSPTPMSFSLAFIEVLGMTVAVPLMFSSRRALMHSVNNQPATTDRILPKRIAMALLLILGVGIVWFATDAAMNSNTENLAASAVEAQ